MPKRIAPIAQSVDLLNDRAGGEGDQPHLDGVKIADLQDREQRLPGDPEGPFHLGIERHTPERGQGPEDEKQADAADHAVDHRLADEIERPSQRTDQKEQQLDESGHEPQGEG